MFQAQPLGLGIALVLIGLAGFLLVWGLLRLVPRIQPIKQSGERRFGLVDIQPHNDAVFVIGFGGRIEYVNQTAREWFDLMENDLPDLELLARRVRPTDDFLELCATEGQARFSINGRQAEGFSYEIPELGSKLILTLRRSETSTSATTQGETVSGSLLKVMTDFGQTIASGLNLLSTLKIVLENIERLVPADLMEVKCWDEKGKALLVYRLSDDQGDAHRIEKASVSQFGEYEKHLIEQKQSLFISDTLDSSSMQFPAPTSRSMTVRSYIGIPLLVGEKLVGTLEVGIFAPEGFAKEDLEVLEMISGQVGVSIKNAQVYEDQQRRNAELTGLANLAQSVGSLREIDELFARLVNNLIALFPAKVLGFLLYDEQKHTLEGRAPFHGMPPNIVEIYHTEIKAGSPADVLLKSQEIILTDDAMLDMRWQDLGMVDIAQAASLHDTALVPLVASERFLGYLQLSNLQKQGSGFNDEDIRLMRIVANQVAAIIENVELIRESRQRVKRSEALRRISNLVSSSAELDEKLRYSVQELSTLMDADAAALFLYDEQQGALRTHMPSLFGVPVELNDPLAKLYIKPSQFQFTVTGSLKPFISGNAVRDRRVLRLYRPLIKRAGVESTIVVPLVVRDHGIGELMLAKGLPDFFDDSDVQLAATVAGQIAAAVDNAAFAGVSDESLRQRSLQMVAVSRIIRDLNSTTELIPLLTIVHEETIRTTYADCSGVYYLERNESGEFTIANAIGHAGLTSLSELDQYVLEIGESVIIANFDDSKYAPPHDGVKSALVSPIAHQGEVVGLISLHSPKEGFFTQSSQEIIDTLSNQAAIALINSKRFQELDRQNDALRRRSRSLDYLVEISEDLKGERTIEDALLTVGKAIRSATPFQVVLFSVYEHETGSLRRVAGLGISHETLESLKVRQQPWASLGQFMKPEFKFGLGYFVPINESPIIPSDVHMVTVLESSEGTTGNNTWDPDDLLIFPLYDDKGEPLGLLSLDAPRDGLRPNKDVLDVLELLTIQASVTLANVRRLQKMRNQVTVLTDEVERQKSLLSVTQTHLPTLLHKDLEQTLALSQLNQRSRRVRAGLSLTDTLSRQLDLTSALMSLGSEILFEFGMQSSIVAENTVEGPRISHVFGNVPRNVNPEALFGQRNPLRTVLQSGETLVVENLDEYDDWNDTSLLNALRAKSFVCLPVIIKERPVAAVLAVNPEPMSLLNADDGNVYHQLSHQVSVTLQNLTLLNEQRRRLQEVNLLLDFSRQLSGLDPKSIVVSLLESALRVVTPAHAGVVLLWNELTGMLVPQVAENYADDDSAMSIMYQPGEGLPGRAFNEKKAYRIDEVRFAVDYNLAAENLIRYRKATAGRLPVSNLVIPIQTSESVLGILVLDNFNTPGAFRSDDEAILLSLTQQVALSLENVRLVQDTQQRASQLQALNDVASTLASSIKRDELVETLLDQLKSIISYDTGILWLRTDNKMVVAAARGFDDSEERIGLQVDISDSVLMNEMISSGRSIAVGNVREDVRFSALLEAEYLSWLGIPLIAKGNTIGAFAVEKVEDDFYTPDLAQLATTFAGQAAVALENATLFEDSIRRAAELNERSQRLALLNRFSAALSGSLNADQVLRLTAEQLLEALNADRASIVIIENNNQAYLQNTLPKKVKEVALQALPEAPFFARLAESLGVFTTDNIADEADLAPIREFLGGSNALMVVPIGAPPQLHAVFIQHEHNHHFAPAEIELARTISNQASIALQNADLYQSTLATAERMAILNEVSAKIGVSLNTEDIYKAVHDATKRLMPVDAFVIALLDEEQGDIDGAYIFDSGQRIMGARLQFGQGLSGQVIETGEPILTVKSAELVERGAVIVGNENAPNSIIAVPMISAGGKVIGALSAQSYQFNAYTADDQQVLSTLANQTAVAIQNGRLFAQTQSFATTLEQRVIERTAELQREQRNTETLLSILTEVSASLDLDRALSRTLALLNDTIGAEQGTIMLLNPEDNLLYYRAGYGYASGTDGMGAAGSGKPTALKVGEGLAGWVVKNRKPALVGDLTLDPRWKVNPNASLQHRSAIVAPLVVGEDVIGSIMVFNRQVNFFGIENLDMVQAIGTQVAISINNARLYELIRDQAERLGVMLRSQQVQASQSQAILESVADGVLVTDQSNQINFVNNSAEKILDLRSNQILGKPLEAFAGLFGRATQTWIETIREWSDNPSEHRAGETYAEQLTLENGQVILVNLAPVIWRNEFLGTVSIFRDITREVEVDRLKSEFVATVSHELRTPMTSIRGYIDILLMGAAGAVSENQRHFLEIVKTNTERLNILVNDLLDISRIEAGRIVLSMQAIDIREVAEDVIESVLRRSQEENRLISVVLDAPSESMRVLGDTDRVRQILDNLVDNAYHYTPDNGRITVRLRPNDGEVQVDVEDTGIGIPLEDQDRVFERFFRGEDPLVLATPGTGLGLPIVQQLVEMHHGQIWMNSSGIPGKGTTFSFTLPVYEAEE